MAAAQGGSDVSSSEKVDFSSFKMAVIFVVLLLLGLKVSLSTSRNLPLKL